MSSGLVYSTDKGRMCPDCSHPAADCICSQKSAEVRGNGNVRVGRETKGRKGSGVTVVTGLAMNEDALLVLAKELKQRCGCGGTVKEGVIEIQGDLRDLIIAELLKKGIKAKKSGG